MKAQGLPIKGPYAQAICFTLMKGCFNHIRSTWSPNGYPPKRLDAATSAAGVTGAAAGGGAAASAAALHRVVAGRQQPSLLARKLLAVLQPPRSKPQRFTFLDNSENINWVALAAATYRDLQAQGVRPSLSVLDMLLSCLRLPLDSSGAAQRHAASTAAAPPLQELAATNGAAGPAATGAAPAQGQAAEAAAHTLGVDDAWADFEDGQADSAAAVTAQLLQDLRREMDLMRAEERPYEQAFDRRALDAVADAVSQGMLPVYKVCAPVCVLGRGAGAFRGVRQQGLLRAGEALLRRIVYLCSWVVQLALPLHPHTHDPLCCLLMPACLPCPCAAALLCCRRTSPSPWTCGSCPPAWRRCMCSPCSQTWSSGAQPMVRSCSSSTRTSAAADAPATLHAACPEPAATAGCATCTCP